jgi:uncharacterized protein (DUF433 family)
LIVATAEVLHGKARIRGTRIPVYLVADCLADGMTDEAIIDGYPSLTVDAIEAVRDFINGPRPPRGPFRLAYLRSRGETNRRIRRRF